MRLDATLRFLRTFKPLKEESGKGYIDFYDRRSLARIRINLTNETIGQVEDSAVKIEIPLREVSTMRMDIYRRQLHVLDLKGKNAQILDFSHRSK